MEEIRTDPITGRKVLIAEGRAGRPSDYATPSESSSWQTTTADNCPFCAGAEEQTPAPTQVVHDESGNWQVRVIPNKYPALTTQSRITDSGDFLPPFSSPQQAYGEHEVVIESPHHIRDLTELSGEQLAVVLQVYRDRLKHWSLDQRIHYVQVFKNFGFAAGASLEHIHSQVVANPFVPATLESELQGAGCFYQQHQRCIFCELLAQELSQRTRIVCEEGPFVAFCAYAGRQPFETWIMPVEHQSDYRMLSEEEAISLASVLSQTLKKMRVQVPQLAYNLILHTVPFGDSDLAHYHWHFEIVPRTTQLAGFEWGTGLFINPLLPETAAKLLRETKV